MFRNKMSRTMAVVGVSTVAAAAVCGCGGSSSKGSSDSSASASTSSGSKSGKHYSVVFVPGATGVSFYETMANGVAAEAKKLGMSYSTQGAADFTPQAQTPVVNAVCSRQPSLLLVAPTDPAAMRSSIQRCMNEGVKVVTVDTGLTDTSGLVSAITSDNLQGGEEAGAEIGKLLHGSGQVATMSLSPTATTQVQRVDGVREALKKFPKISIVSNQFTQQAPSSSLTTARAVLSGHPGVTAFFGAAEPNTEGVAGTGKKLVNIGYDAAAPEVALLKQGKISALVIQQPAKEGMLGVQYGDDALTGKTSQVKKSVELPNVLVTTAQANSPASKKYYYTGS